MSTTTENNYTVTVNIVPAGTQTDTGKSSAGHMFYTLTSPDGTKNDFGYNSGKDPAGITGPGDVSIDDSSHYDMTADGVYQRTINITAEQYNNMLDYGEARRINPGIVGGYNAFNNSCVDFTWNALEIGGLNPSGDEGDLLPSHNKDEVDADPSQNIRQPRPLKIDSNDVQTLQD